MPFCQRDDDNKMKNKEKKDFKGKIYSLFRDVNLKRFFIFFIFYYLIGIYANYRVPFPLYIYFASIFCFIAITAVLAIRFYLKQMDLILIEISGEPKFRKAKYEYERLYNKKIVFVIPFFAIFVYAGTGIPMIKSFELNCSMIFALATFVPTVYISILVYIQYILLAIFIYHVNNCDDKYLSYIEPCPANSKILQLLSSLVNVYRNSFFAIGTAYIIAFGLFTLSNAFGVDVSVDNFCLVLGWVIIAVAIVTVFPIVSLLEKWWMSSIVRDLKTISTKKIQNDFRENNSDKLQASDLIISIWQTPDYPIKESISWGYGFFATLVNLITILYYAKELFQA